MSWPRVVGCRSAPRLTLRDAAGARARTTGSPRPLVPEDGAAGSVFTGAGEARLVLVTCGGAFDAAAHHYSDNIVVYAVPVAS